MKTRIGKSGRSNSAFPADTGDATPRPLRERVAEMDALLAIFAAGLSARRHLATPAGASAMAAVVATFADAASAPAAEAEAGLGGRRAARWAAALASAGMQLRGRRAAQAPPGRVSGPGRIGPAPLSHPHGPVVGPIASPSADVMRALP